MYIQIDKPTMPEVRAAAKRFEKKNGVKVFVKKGIWSHQVDSNFFYNISRLNAINFFNQNIVLREKILEECPDYATLIWEGLDNFKFLKEIDFTKKLVARYAEAIGCFEAKYNDEGSLVEYDEETMFNNHDAEILEKIIRDEFTKIGFTVTFVP